MGVRTYRQCVCLCMCVLAATHGRSMIAYESTLKTQPKIGRGDRQRGKSTDRRLELYISHSTLSGHTIMSHGGEGVSCFTDLVSIRHSVSIDPFILIGFETLVRNRNPLRPLWISRARRGSLLGRHAHGPKVRQGKRNLLSPRNHLQGPAKVFPVS